jgi:hypothetical protein
MRFLYFLFPVLLLTGCGGRSFSTGNARDMLLSLPQDALEKEDIDVVKVTQSSGSKAIAETRLKAAFRLEKDHGKWQVREVRLGHGQWEKIGNLERALEMVRIEETRNMLDRVAQAIEAYKKAKGNWPEFRDYIALSDLLSPAYMTPLIRLDAWRRPFGASRTNDTIHIWSSGQDGKAGTTDDIRKILSLH